MLCLMLLLILPLVLPAISHAETEFDLSAPGLRIGVESGSVQALLLEKLYPNAELYYFTKMDGYNAVSQGKIDCFVYDKKQMEIAAAKGIPNVRVLDQTVGEETKIAFGLSPVSAIPDLADSVNAFIAEQQKNGTLDEMADRWVTQGSTELPEIALPTAPKYHLKVGTTGIVEPYSFFIGTELTGYDIELSYRLAAWLDADVSFDLYDYGSIVEAARSGKVDVIAANLQITPERADALQFSDPLYREQNGIMVRDTTAALPKKTVTAGDYNGKKIGVLVGPLMEDAAHTYFPDSEYFLFDSYPDCITALLSGKIDGFLGDEPGIKSVHAEQPEVDYIHESLTENNYSFAFRKDDPESAALCEEFNAFLAKCWEDGTMRELDEIWFGVDEARKIVDMSGLTGTNGTIRVVTTATDMPWSYVKDGSIVGYDIDLVVRFCRDRGYALKLGDVDFAGRIPAIQSGKYDFTTDMNVTPEREEEVRFSEPTAHGGIVLAVRSSDLAAASADGGETDGRAKKVSFLSSIRMSFEKTFLRESRWKLFVKGVENTLLITILSILLGTALGFGMFMLCRNGNAAANAVTRFCVWLVQGMPMVVLLMVLYYIVFGNVAISGIAVAVVGFTLTFGAAVFALMKMGVGVIDAGQYEAAYALGHSNRRTFYRVILPQAIPHVLPAYRGEIVSLLKATAVVGYIAVQDLTKMGDIVRSRTYEAFFPLIAVTVIYFLMEGITNALIRWLQMQINPKKRSRERILKGVKTDD